MIDLEVTALVLAHLSTEKAHRDALRLRVVARIDVGVTAGDLADHSADHVIEVKTGLDIRQESCILLLDGLPVAAVHILKIVAVAEGSPDLIEDLWPLLSVVNGCVHVIKVDCLASADFRGREADGCPFALGSRKCLLVSRTVEDHSFGTLFGLTGLEIKHLCATTVPVPQFLAVAEIGS